MLFLFVFFLLSVVLLPLSASHPHSVKNAFEFFFFVRLCFHSIFLFRSTQAFRLCWICTRSGAHHCQCTLILRFLLIERVSHSPFRCSLVFKRRFSKPLAHHLCQFVILLRFADPAFARNHCHGVTYQTKDFFFV